MNDAAGESVGHRAAEFDQAANGISEKASARGRRPLSSTNGESASGATNSPSPYTNNALRHRLSSRSASSAASSTDNPHRNYSLNRRFSNLFDHPEGSEFSGDDDYDPNTLPSRWWFAASAFPMAAGTLGPVASAFSICALVRPWRQVILEGQTIENADFIDDPVWLTTINAVQLFIAVAANIFLLLNMARRIRFSIAQPVTMTGWFISSFTLIALTATAAGPLQSHIPKELNMVWSQAFYYAIYSAVLYLFVGSLMVVTFMGAWTGHYPKDFQLTNSQRTLMLQTIMFLMYLLVGAVIFSKTEGWAFLDGVYWADVTLFTVGFGDFAAKTTLGRALLFPYAFIGIISLGLVIGSIRSLALERGATRLDARMTEKNRRKFLARIAKKGKDDILQPIQSEPDGQFSLGDGDGEASNNSSRALPRNSKGMTELQRREEEFNIMRKIQHISARKRRWQAMATSGGIWLLLWLLGAYIFQVCEKDYQDWDYFGGFYLAFVSLTTMGYGDMTPISNAGKSFFVFWSLMALPTTTVLISDAGDTVVKAISDATNAVGRVTILPGEKGLKKDFKELVRALTCGAIFQNLEVEEVAPGLLGFAQTAYNQRHQEEAEEEAAEEEEAEDAVNEVEEARAQEEADENQNVDGDNSDNDSDDSGESDENNENDAADVDGEASGEADEDANSDEDTIQQNTSSSEKMARPSPSSSAEAETREFDEKDSPGVDTGTPDQENTAEKPGGASSGPTALETVVAGVAGSAAAARVPNSSNAPQASAALAPDGYQLHPRPSDLSINDAGSTHSDCQSSLTPRRGTGMSDDSVVSNSQPPSIGPGRRHRHHHNSKKNDYATNPATAPYKIGSAATLSTARVNFPDELPAARSEYHCLLMDEIARVTEHLRHTPPRKYTFQEWAWYLKLIGEDESSAENHRKADTNVRDGRRGSTTGLATGSRQGSMLGMSEAHSQQGSVDTIAPGAPTTSGTPMAPSPQAGPSVSLTSLHRTPSHHVSPHLQWSWVGARSPLMGSQEEAEWILDKLMRRLQSELRLIQQVDEDFQKRRSAGWSPPGWDGATAPVLRHTHSIREEPHAE